jgi:CubicO group peptidase (beta-lactamase class C family)
MLLEKTMRKGKYFFVFSVFFVLALTSRLPVLAQENASTFPQSSAEDVGMSSEKLRQVVKTVQEWVDDGELVGAVMLVIRHDKVVLHEAVGWSDEENDIPMDVGTIFQMRSMTKPLTATAILLLMEEGRLLLSDRVSRYLPSFDNPRSNDIRIRHLLTHTSGLLSDNLIDQVSGLFRFRAYASLREAVDVLGGVGPTFQPGTDHQYSSNGSATLGALIEEISGMPADEFIQQRILDPLRMEDSFFEHMLPDDPRRSRVGAAYRRESGKWTKYWDNSQGDPRPWYPYFHAAGGLVSTASDYATFMTMMLHGGRVGTNQLLSPATVEMATSPHSTYVYDAAQLRRRFSFYGLHWAVFSDKYRSIPTVVSAGTFRHGGWLGTTAWADPQQDLIAIYLTQSRGHQTMARFRNLVYAAIVK